MNKTIRNALAILVCITAVVAIAGIGVQMYAELAQIQLNKEYGQYLMHSPCSRPGDGYGPPLRPGMEGGLG